MSASAEGDRVAYLGQNAPELLDLLFACARLGAILVPLSARMPAPELEVVLANTEPKALLAEAEYAQTAGEAGDALELRVIPFGAAIWPRAWRRCSRARPSCAAIVIVRRRRRWRSSTPRARRARRRAPC